jgi:oleate hydratase
MARGQQHLVGGGIASLAAAVCLIRDAGIPGGQVTISDPADVFGGCIDASGSPSEGYLTRGARMFERHFVCTFDLLSTIPSLDRLGLTVTEEILRFNEEVVSDARCRLVREGHKVDAARLGLGARNIRDMVVLMGRSEASLDGRAIEDCFSEGFFASHFWILWATTFAFERWHSAAELRRYFRRFIHLFPGFSRLQGILRTPLNQHDSIVAPLVAWLTAQGVRWQPRTSVTELVFAEGSGGRARVQALLADQDGRGTTVPVGPDDDVYVTLGSMTEAASVGGHSSPPPTPDATGPAVQFWQRLAETRDLGRPDAFFGQPDRTRWCSFTVTLGHSGFFEHMQSFTGNVAGTGGLVTFVDSAWLMSIVLFHQPHFRGQAENRLVFWGYGLFPDRPGDHVGRPMSACSGQDLLDELAGQLRLGPDQARLLFADAIAIPCLMPFITSQFMPRRPGDRPPVVPDDVENLCLLGQYVELPHDVVFTVEYSVRTAMTAVGARQPRARPVPPVRRTDHDPAVLWRALRTMLG